jgi:hypothetical protein
VGGGSKSLSRRPGSHDLEFQEGAFAYLDTYFGGADFIGQEAVWFEGQPVWAMNYYGRILEPERITGAQAGRIIQASLSAMYREGRFMGGYEYRVEDSTYFDTNRGDAASFTGREWIDRGGVTVYELVYHGGLIQD